MKKIVAIGLLVLLLYNTFGLTTAILLFDKQYKMPSDLSLNDDYQLLKIPMPSLPYTSEYQNSDGLEGLIKTNGNFYNATEVLHANDTLYVTIKSNQPARDHFFELADKMQSVTENNSTLPENSHGKALKLLNNLLKNYLQNDYRFVLQSQQFISALTVPNYTSVEAIHIGWLASLQTPPPECPVFS